MADPARTHALVIGVETYDIGPSWNLPGPIDDGVRFVDWLLQRGVPPANIIFCSSLAVQTNARGVALAAPALDIPPGVEQRSATHDVIESILVEELPTKAPELLWIYWGGHGVMRRGTHRLFTANASDRNRRNIDLRSLLEFLAGTGFSSAANDQIVVIDACAHHAELDSSSGRLPRHEFPEGTPNNSCRQYVFQAARRGEAALNNSTARFGLFSRELLALLKAAPIEAWPPDLGSLQRTLETRFKRLRAANRLPQTPSFLRFTDWDGGISEPLPRDLSAATRPESPVLQIVFHPSGAAYQPGADATRFRTSAWLWGSPDQPSDFEQLDDSHDPAWLQQDHPASALPALIARIVKLALGRLATDNMRLELFLPVELVALRFDESPYGQTIRTPLGRKWPAALRLFERAYPDPLTESDELRSGRKTWGRKWNDLCLLNNGSTQARFSWACQSTDYTAPFFDDLLDQHGLVGFSLHPAAGAHVRDAEELLLHVLCHGLPIALWLHDHTGAANSSRQILETELHPVSPAAWPEAIRRIRGLRPAFCSGLSLLWDPADFLPPDATSPGSTQPSLAAPLSAP